VKKAIARVAKLSNSRPVKRLSIATPFSQKTLTLDSATTGSAFGKLAIAVEISADIAQNS
jgi:hypothetical protein